MLRRLLIGVVALLLVAIGGFLLSVNVIAHSLIESGGSSALGVETKLGFARLRLLAGDVRLSRIRIANPGGFDEPYFLTVRRADIDAELSNLRDDVVKVPLISIEGVTVALERSGKRTNYDVILANMKSGQAAAKADPEDSEDEQRFVVERMVIRDVEAHVEWSGLASNQTGVDLQIEEILLKDLGEEGGGLDAAELTNVIVKAVLGAIARSGAALPGALLAGLHTGLRGVGELPSLDVSGVGGSLLDSGRGLGSATGTAASKGLDAVGGAAKRLFGGDEGGD